MHHAITDAAVGPGCCVRVGRHQKSDAVQYYESTTRPGTRRAFSRVTTVLVGNGGSVMDDKATSCVNGHKYTQEIVAVVTSIEGGMWLTAVQPRTN